MATKKKEVINPKEEIKEIKKDIKGSKVVDKKLDNSKDVKKEEVSKPVSDKISSTSKKPISANIKTKKGSILNDLDKLDVPKSAPKSKVKEQELEQPVKPKPILKYDGKFYPELLEGISEEGRKEALAIIESIKAGRYNLSEVMLFSSKYDCGIQVTYESKALPVFKEEVVSNVTKAKGKLWEETKTVASSKITTDSGTSVTRQQSYLYRLLRG